MKKYFLIIFGILLFVPYLTVTAQKPVVTPNQFKINFFQTSPDGERVLFSNLQVSLYDTSDNLIKTGVVRDGAVTFADIPNGAYTAKGNFSGYFAPDQNNISCRNRCDPDILFEPPYNYDRNIGARVEREILSYKPGELLVIFRESAGETDINILVQRYGVAYEPLREAGTNKILLTFRHGTIQVGEGKEKEVLRSLLGESLIDKIYLASLRGYTTRFGPDEESKNDNLTSKEKPVSVTEQAVPTGSYPEQVLNKIGDRVWNYKVALAVTLVVLLTISALLVGFRSSKKIVKVPLVLVGVIGASILLILLYNFFVLGQKDLGILYQYSYCENGIYSIYPRGIVDGGSAYYNRQGEKLGWCDAWGVTGDKCKETVELAGTCQRHSMFGW